MMKHSEDFKREAVRIGSCPPAWCNWGRSPRHPASARAGHVPGTAESMTMGLSLTGAIVSRDM
jgi:hypothetical protein